MFKRINMYTCVCDRCGKEYECEEYDIIAFETKEQAFYYANTFDDWKEIDGKHYCPDCYDYDPYKEAYVPLEEE